MCISYNFNLDSVKRSVAIQTGTQIYIESLPKELLLHIFSFLKSHGLRACCLVSRKWKQLAKEEFLWKQVIEQEIAFSPQHWRRYWGNVDPERSHPSLPSNILEILTSPSPVDPCRSVAQTFMLLFIPQFINGRPLNPIELGDLAKYPREGFSTGYDRDTEIYFREGICQSQNQFWDPCGPYPTDLLLQSGVSESYWALITKTTIPQGEVKGLGEQENLLKSLGYMKYQVPTVLEIAMASFAHYVRTGKPLYHDCYTLCRLSPYSDSRALVGQSGLGVLSIRHSYALPHPNIGISALQKL